MSLRAGRSAAGGWALVVLMATLGPLAACGDDGGNKGQREVVDEPDAETPNNDAPDADLPDADEPDADAPNNDTPRPPEHALSQPQPGVDPEGVDITAPAVEGQARVGVVREGTGGFGGVQATCRPGCFALVNTRARFCIDAEANTSQLFFDGGRIIDAEPVGPAPLERGGRDRLDVASPMVDLKVGSATTVEVIRDGSDGGQAVLRVTGREEPVMYLAGVVGPSFFRTRPLEIVTEYRLAPDSAALEVVTVIINEGQNLTTVLPGDIMFWGDTLGSYFPGFERAPLGVQGVMAFGRGISYGWFTEGPAGSTQLQVISLPAVPLTVDGARLEPGDAMSWRRWLAVGEHTTDVMAALGEVYPEHPLLGGEFAEATVRVTRDGQGVTGAEVRLTAQDAPGPALIEITDEDGALPLRLAPGAYTLHARGPVGREATVEVQVSQGAELTLDLPPVAELSLEIDELRDGASTPSPARVRLVEAETRQDRLVNLLRGRQVVTLPPGRWRYEVSRGGEYTVASGEVTLEPGGRQTLAASLERVVPTPGFVSGEFHQHQTASLDSTVAVVDRVVSNIAEGVDFAVSSDHDVATDYRPVIEELGAADLIASLAGVEISPLWGHFGAYPVDVDPNATAGGALPLAYKDQAGEVFNYQDGHELFPAIRQQLGARLIQVNHPRDNSPYFDSSNFDRTQPLTMADAGFSLDFDTMEVVNGDICEPIQDFYALLNQGHRVVGVGNSDTHGLSQPVGYPRNYVPAQVDGPEALTDDMIVDATLSGDLVISAVAYLEFGPGSPADPDAVRPGRLVNATSVTIDVRALTPPWAEVTRLFVVRNGLVVEELEIGGGVEEIVDFDGPITLEVEGGRDAWFQIIAWNPAPAQVVYPGKRIYAMSNPFYLDADGDGEFDAPGVIALDPSTIVFCQ